LGARNSRRDTATLEPWYESEPGRIEYVEYPGVGHFLTPELTAESGRRLVAWFQRWLRMR
jgi:hypothetical protein